MRKKDDWRPLQTYNWFPSLSLRFRRNGEVIIMTVWLHYKLICCWNWGHSLCWMKLQWVSSHSCNSLWIFGVNWTSFTLKSFREPFCSIVFSRQICEGLSEQQLPVMWDSLCKLDSAGESDPTLFVCRSCISWSSYHKNLLASSDYEGTVILWDGFTGQRSKVYQVRYYSWSVESS